MNQLKNTIIPQKTENYTVGFAFRLVNGCREVMLITKQRPDWQKGRLNGIGGRIENESPEECMAREFKEETGIFTAPDYWKKFCIIYGDVWLVHFYFTHDIIEEPKTVTDEVPSWYHVYDILQWNGHGAPNPNILNNLPWLIPMALSRNPIMAIVEDTFP